MEYQVLRFATPMVSRWTAEVHRAIQQLHFQLRAEGLPVVRVHSDRARELKTPQLCEWLAARDILQTTGEAQAPQTNGKAEQVVKQLKTRGKDSVEDFWLATILLTLGYDLLCVAAA